MQPFYLCQVLTRRFLAILTLACAVGGVAGNAQSQDETPTALPNEHGQIWKEYDLRPYSQRLPNQQNPEQAIIDWVVRETGTEIWFAEPLGLLSANRNTLTVYHTPEIHAAVAEIVARFTRVETDKNVFGIRMVSVDSPNWRTKSLSMLKPLSVQTPGTEAWLIKREDAARLLDDLGRRSDFREYSTPNLMVRNGQTHIVQRTRPMAYVKSINSNLPGNYGQEMGQIEEGFTLKLSPLLATDKREAEAVLKLEASQLEQMNNVNVPTTSANQARQMAQVQVPQTSSWRLHERFRWPIDQVLVISCGVVPRPSPNATGPLGLRPLVQRGPPRSDALIFIESKGSLSDIVASSQGEERYEGLNYRGRY
jgi:hypothetical protein